MWTENRADHAVLFPWGELLRARELVGILALRDLRVRYKQASLGVLWVVVQPVILVGAFTLAFDRLAHVDSQGVPYPVFALAGLIGWTYLSQAITRGSEVLVGNASLITKVYIPRLVAPTAALLPCMVDLAVGLVLFAITAVVLGVAPGLTLLLLPVWLVALAVTALGPVLLLAAANVRYRDVRHVVGPMLQALMFLSPVAYSARGLDGVAQWLYALNPAVGVLEFGRFVLVGAPVSGPEIVLSFGVALLLAAVGLVHFQRAQRTFADVI